MCLIKQSLIALACFLCTNVASAQLAKNNTSSVRKASPSIEDLAVQQSNASIIEAINIDHTNDPGNIHIQSLLAKQLVSPRIEMESNEYIQEYINKYSTSRYRSHLGKMLGLSQYYFPIFEKALSKTGVPNEIKYLTIIESALNPNAVSRMGATGPWQFMYATAKEHGLIINSYVDERKDPVSASYAAANYLKDSYNFYQDWLLAIASYNCGRGNVNKAISRSGLINPTFWEIRRYLPRETQNYIPAFIAMHQVLENHEQLDIIAQESPFSNDTEQIMVDREVSLTTISHALSVPESTILALNPAYKRKVIKGSKDNLQRLIVPSIEKSDYSKLYLALHADNSSNTSTASFASNTSEKTLSKKIHQVLKGENLEKIALKHEVTIQDLKVWNNLKNNIIVPGQKLKIETHQSSKQNQLTKEKQYITYKVKRGDTLSTIANRYKNTNINQLKAMNNLRNSVLRIGMTLKVSEI